jgi:hypothetical protein
MTLQPVRLDPDELLRQIQSEAFLFAEFLSWITITLIKLQTLVH